MQEDDDKHPDDLLRAFQPRVRRAVDDHPDPIGGCG
jgi:hypothetical protein